MIFFVLGCGMTTGILPFRVVRFLLIQELLATTRRTKVVGFAVLFDLMRSRFLYFHSTDRIFGHSFARPSD